MGQAMGIPMFANEHGNMMKFQMGFWIHRFPLISFGDHLEGFLKESKSELLNDCDISTTQKRRSCLVYLYLARDPRFLMENKTYIYFINLHGSFRCFCFGVQDYSAI